jgi:hypothetical protein
MMLPPRQRSSKQFSQTIIDNSSLPQEDGLENSPILPDNRSSGIGSLPKTGNQGLNNEGSIRRSSTNQLDMLRSQSSRSIQLIYPTNGRGLAKKLRDSLVNTPSNPSYTPIGNKSQPRFSFQQQDFPNQNQTSLQQSQNDIQHTLRELHNKSNSIRNKTNSLLLKQKQLQKNPNHSKASISDQVRQLVAEKDQEETNHETSSSSSQQAKVRSMKLLLETWNLVADSDIRSIFLTEKELLFMKEIAGSSTNDQQNVILLKLLQPQQYHWKRSMILQALEEYLTLQPMTSTYRDLIQLPAPNYGHDTILHYLTATQVPPPSPQQQDRSVVNPQISTTTLRSSSVAGIQSAGGGGNSDSSATTATDKLYTAPSSSEQQNQYLTIMKQYDSHNCLGIRYESLLEKKLATRNFGTRYFVLMLTPEYNPNLYPSQSQIGTVSKPTQFIFDLVQYRKRMMSCWGPIGLKLQARYRLSCLRKIDINPQKGKHGREFTLTFSKYPDDDDDDEEEAKAKLAVASVAEGQDHGSEVALEEEDEEEEDEEEEEGEDEKTLKEEEEDDAGNDEIEVEEAAEEEEDVEEREIGEGKEAEENGEEEQLDDEEERKTTDRGESSVKRHESDIDHNGDLSDTEQEDNLAHAHQIQTIAAKSKEPTRKSQNLHPAETNPEERQSDVQTLNPKVPKPGEPTIQSQTVIPTPPSTTPVVPTAQTISTTTMPPNPKPKARKRKKKDTITIILRAKDSEERLKWTSILQQVVRDVQRIATTDAITEQHGQQQNKRVSLLRGNTVSY